MRIRVSLLALGVVSASLGLNGCGGATADRQAMGVSPSLDSAVVSASPSASSASSEIPSETTTDAAEPSEPGSVSGIETQDGPIPDDGSALSFTRAPEACIVIGPGITDPVLVEDAESSRKGHTNGYADATTWKAFNSVTLNPGEQHCATDGPLDDETFFLVHLPGSTLAVRVANFPYTLPKVWLNNPNDNSEYAGAYFWENETQTLVGDGHSVLVQRGSDTSSAQHFTLTFQD